MLKRMKVPIGISVCLFLSGRKVEPLHLDLIMVTITIIII